MNRWKPIFLSVISIAIFSVLQPDKLVGEDITVHRGEIVSVPINPKLGTLIEFPRAIQVVSDTEHYLVSSVATTVDKKSQKPIDVTIVKVKPRRSGRIEDVPFVLTGKKTVTLRFLTVAGASKHHRIKFPAPIHTDLTNNGRLLEKEVRLM